MKQEPVLKAQSAMEYLMTYGWAILIISVVLGALFSLGVFSGSTLLGTSCIASPGYQCLSPTLLTTGVLTYTVGQNTGATEYNAVVYVVPQGAPLNTAGFPIAGWTVSNMIGNFFSGSSQTISIQLNSNQVVNGYTTLGNTFAGYVWVNYTSLTSNTNAPSNVAVKVATLTAKVV